MLLLCHAAKYISFFSFLQGKYCTLAQMLKPIPGFHYLANELRGEEEIFYYPRYKEMMLVQEFNGFDYLQFQGDAG